MTELAAQPIRRATSFRENFAPSSLSARLRRSESSSAEPFGRMGTSYRQEVHYCIILCEVNSAGSAVRGTFYDLQALGAGVVAIGALLALGDAIAAFASEHYVALELLERMPN